MSVYIEDDQAVVESVETTSTDDYNELVEKYRQKEEEYVIQDLRRVSGRIVVKRVRSVEDAAVLSDDRRERIYDARNRILEHAGGSEQECLNKVRKAVDDILSTCGVPNRVIVE